MSPDQDVCRVTQELGGLVCREIGQEEKLVVLPRMGFLIPLWNETTNGVILPLEAGGCANRKFIHGYSLFKLPNGGINNQIASEIIVFYFIK